MHQIIQDHDDSVFYNIEKIYHQKNEINQISKSKIKDFLTRIYSVIENLKNTQDLKKPINKEKEIIQQKLKKLYIHVLWKKFNEYFDFSKRTDQLYEEAIDFSIHNLTELSVFKSMFDDQIKKALGQFWKQ